MDFVVTTAWEYLEERRNLLYFPGMSFTEIKAGIARLTVEERLEVAGLIAHLNRADDPVWQAELDRRLDAMAAGRKSTQRDVENCHHQLSSQGR